MLILQNVMILSVSEPKRLRWATSNLCFCRNC